MGFQCFFKQPKIKGKFSDNFEQNICRLFHFLVQFVFTTSETELFGRFLIKNRKKSAVKHSIEKPISLNFVNLSPTFCPRVFEGTDFHL